MAKSTLSVRARLSEATARRRKSKKQTNQAGRVFGDVKELVSDVGDRLLGGQGRRKAGTKQVSAKKAGASRIRSGQRRQAAAKGVGAKRIHNAKKRQAAGKNAARKRGGKTS